MSVTVVGVFDRMDFAEKAAREIKERGLRTDDISILVKNGDQVESTDGMGMVNDNISNGAVTGGIIGGLAGLLIGAGLVAIPGLGIIAAAGPITGLIGGAATGGIIGGLVDLGIPEEESKRYESDVKSGKVVFTMKTDQEKVDDIRNILQSNGAERVNAH
ncbi:MAG: general stress protein [Thermoclostridium sp.]|nr:general stress protein [Thermoclostridium sp.]